MPHSQELQQWQMADAWVTHQWCICTQKWDMERARRQGWKFGAKLVRGAYLDLEAARAKEKGYDSPIWGDIEHTHANYNRSAASWHATMQRPFLWPAAETQMLGSRQHRPSSLCHDLHACSLQPL